jgi:serine/threonine protein kinase
VEDVLAVPTADAGLMPAVIGVQPLAADDPRRISDIPIRGVLGSGGMGQVYLGLTPQGYAAVKRMRPELADDAGFAARFSQELANQARLPAGVSARLLASNVTSRPPWFAAEYIPGVTLAEAAQLSGGRLPAGTVWALLRDMAAHLRVLSRLDLVHRDLKPSNIMLTDGGLTLIDFGVAREVAQSPQTTTGKIVGTPLYMAPEQAAGARPLTPAADVFALGSVLCFAATGTVPFGGGPI